MADDPEPCACVIDPEDGSTITACVLHPGGGSPIVYAQWALNQIRDIDPKLYADLAIADLTI